MAKTMRNMASAVASVFALVAPVRAAAQPAGRIVVHVVDYANVPPVDLHIAMAETSRIFAAAGAEVVWAEGEREGNHPEANVHLNVVLLDHRMGRSKIKADHVGDDVLGQAAHCSGRAYIFTERISKKGFTSGAGFSRVLGRVMAHEMGHLVLPVGSHSMTGIMQEGGDMRTNSSPKFTPEQAAWIAREVTVSAATGN